MSTKNKVLRMSLFVLLLGMVAYLPAFAGSAVIGSVAGSMNATVGGQALLPNTTLYSGDSLQVKDGVAVVAVGQTSRLVFGRDTVASFLRDATEVTVLLSQGSVSVFHPDGNDAVRVKAGDVSIAPASGFKSLGEVAMAGGSVVVTAKEGSLNVGRDGKNVKVAKGQTITITPKTANKAGAAAWGGGCPNCALAAGALGAGVVAAILSGVAMSRSGDAKDAANQASATASAAKSSADQAASDAAAAAAAAAAAQASADNAAWLAGCTLNAEFQENGQPSPYHGPNYQDCPEWNPPN